MLVQSYLFFEGRCEEALAFYRERLGAEVLALLRFRDSPEPAMCPEGSTTSGPMLDKVMHAAFRIGETTILASDGRSTGQASFQGFALTITAADRTEGERLFRALADAEEGQVMMPYAETFFAERFGMVTDRFGVMWMIIAGPRG